MSCKQVRRVVGFLALTIGGLALSSQAQQPKVNFKFANLSVPGAMETDALAINNKGMVAGDYINAAGTRQGMLLKGGNVTAASCPAGGATAFYGVNSGGSAAEAYDDGGDAYCGNGITFYQILHHHWNYVPENWGALVTETIGINDMNLVVGLWQDANQQLHGFSYNLSTNGFVPLDPPGSGGTVAWGVNNAGLITLEAVDPASGLVHSYLFNGNSYINIDVPGALQSFAHGINNNGDIVYTVEDANGNSWGVFFYATLQQFYWFNQPDGRDNTRGYGINDEVATRAGTRLKIVGEYTPVGSTQNLAYEATVSIKP